MNKQKSRDCDRCGKTYSRYTSKMTRIAFRKSKRDHRVKWLCRSCLEDLGLLKILDEKVFNG